MKNIYYLFFSIVTGISTVLLFSCDSSKSNDVGNSQNGSNMNDLLEIENGILRSQSQTDYDNNKMHLNLESLKLKKSEMYDSIHYAMFKRITKRTQEMSIYVTHLRGELIAKSEGCVRTEGDTLRLSLLKNPFDATVVNDYMIGANPNESVASELAKKISDFEMALDSLTPNGSFKSNYPISCIGFYLRYSNSKDKSEITMFRDRPLINALLVLESIRLQVCIAENRALHANMDERWMKYMTKPQESDYGKSTNPGVK